jgi:hypothetical protein
MVKDKPPQPQMVADETAIFTDAETLEDLSEQLDKFEEDEWAYVEDLVNGVLSQNETCAEKQALSGLKVVDVETEDYVGQAVRQNGTIIDMTLLAREAAERGFRFRR